MATRSMAHAPEEEHYAPGRLETGARSRTSSRQMRGISHVRGSLSPMFIASRRNQWRSDAKESIRKFGP
jgi:hypothetical protein